MRIHEEKVWSLNKVRLMCINHNYYTCGDNEDYSKMLNFVSTHQPTKMNIYKVAKDIVKHSDLEGYGQSETENIEGVMFDISAEAVSTHYQVEE